MKISIHVGEYFPGEPVGWDASRVLRFDRYGNIRREHFVVTMIDNLLDIRPSDDSSGVMVSPAEEGSYLFVLNWSPRLIELEPDIFHQYLKAEGLDEILDLRERRSESQKVGRERYSRYAKTFVQIGEHFEPGWRQVVGQKIEILPGTNPCALEVGDTVCVQVLYEGEPLSNALVSAAYAGFTTEPDSYAQGVRTDSDGRARFHMTHSGPWMVRGVHMVPLEGDPEADWESFWASITFSVKNEHRESP